MIGSTSAMRILAASSLRKLVESPSACRNGLSMSLSSLLSASRISRSAGCSGSLDMRSRASSYFFPRLRALSSSSCISLMSVCRPMLRITADCSSASAFMLAATSSLARAASITPASSSRLRWARSVPPTETSTMMATIAPKASASRVPMVILRRNMGSPGGRPAPPVRPPQNCSSLLVDAAADDQVLVATQVHRLRLDLAAHGIHELVVLPSLCVGTLGHHLDALLDEELAIIVTQFDDVLADHLLVGAVGENLALHVVDDDIKISVDERPALVVEVGEGLVPAHLLDVRDRLVDHRGGLGCRAFLGVRLLRGGRNAQRQNERREDDRKMTQHGSSPSSNVTSRPTHPLSV